MRRTYSKGDKVYLVHRARDIFSLDGKTCVNTVSGPLSVAETMSAADRNEGTFVRLTASPGSPRATGWIRTWHVFTTFDEAKRYARYLGTLTPNALNCDILRIEFENDLAETRRRGHVDYDYDNDNI